MKIDIFENTKTKLARKRTYVDPVDPVLEKVSSDCYILSFRIRDFSVLKTLVYFSHYYSKNYVEIDNKKYNIFNIPENFDKINALLEKYKLSRAIEKLP